MGELNPGYIAIIGFVAMLVVYGVQVVAAKSGKTIGKEVIAGICFTISVFLAYIFMQPSIPEVQDTSTFVQELLTIAGSVMGFATLVYNALFSRVLDKLDKKPETFLPENKKIGEEAEVS